MGLQPLAFVLHVANALLALLDFLLQLPHHAVPFRVGQGGFAQRAMRLGAVEQQVFAFVVLDFLTQRLVLLRQGLVEPERQRRVSCTRFLELQRLPFDVGQLPVQPLRLFLPGRQRRFLLPVFRLPVQKGALLQFQGVPLPLDVAFDLAPLLLPHVPLLQRLRHFGIAPAGRLQCLVCLHDARLLLHEGFAGLAFGVDFRAPLLGVLQLDVEALASRCDGMLQGCALVVQRGVFVRLLAICTFLVAELLQRLVRGGDGLFLLQQGFITGEMLTVQGQLRRQIVLFLPELLQAPRHVPKPLLLQFQVVPALLQAGQTFLGFLEFGLQARQRFPVRLHRGGKVGLASDLLLQLVQALGKGVGLLVQSGVAVPGAALELVEDGQAEDFRQDAFALAGPPGGEFVGAALQDEHRVDEGVVVHVQELHDFGLGLADGVAAQGAVAPGCRVEAVQFEGREAAAGAQAALAQHAVAVALEVEDELDLAFLLAQAHDVVEAFGARLAPQRPGDGVQQGRFAVAVVARQAGGGDGGEVERRNLLAVAHEIPQSQAQRNHARRSSCISWSSKRVRSSRAGWRSAYSGRLCR